MNEGFKLHVLSNKSRKERKELVPVILNESEYGMPVPDTILNGA